MGLIAWKAWRTAGALAMAGVLPGGCVSPRAVDPGRFDLERVPIQWGVGGSVRDEFSVRGCWGEVSGAFEPRPADARAERRSIARAIGAIERCAGRQTPTWNDRARGTNHAGDPGQMDCVDESTNTTNYLWMLWHEGLLRYHAVEAPRWRMQYVLFDPHRTAVVREVATGQLWAVDSWVRDNGEEPDVQRIESWRRKDPPPPEAE